jgi:YbgC/YbaW family acyl-CoA thioester hydrolase
LSKVFSKSFRVSWNEINASGEVGLSAYFQYVVETAWAWGAANGLGEAESDAAGLAWVIRETELGLHRPLRSRDEFELTIWLKDWRRVRGTRCFELRIKDGGELIAQGVQEIVVLDSTTLRPVPAPRALIEHLRMENPRLVPHQEFPKYRNPEGAAFVTERAVEWRDLDWQEHVNNSIYPAFAEEAAVRALASLGWPPAEQKAQGVAVVNRRVHIQYQSPASWGERLRVGASLMGLKSTGGTWYVEMERPSDHELISRCILEWSAMDRASGAVKELPETVSEALRERLATGKDDGS